MRAMQGIISRVFAVLLVVGCGAAPSTPTARPLEPSSKAPDEFAPQLFTLEQLREGVPAGRVIELRIEVEYQTTTIEHWEFTHVDANGATIHSISRDTGGTVISDETGTSTWAELHSHAKFPAAATTFEDNVSVTVPAGTFTTRLYTMKASGVTRQFWFAIDLPGPPVQFTTEQDGKVMMRAVMLRAR
jgi:hypothetical protein